MNLCRICLSTTTNKNIYDLKIGKKPDIQSYSEILQFCLNIQVDKSIKVTSKLCNKCYRRILEYHKFKTLALKNDAYLKTIKLNFAVKEEQCSNEDTEYLNNNYGIIHVFDNEFESVGKNILNHTPDLVDKQNFNNETGSGDKLISSNEAHSIGNDSLNLCVKEEQVIKVESGDQSIDQESDNELLSVIKQIKEENPWPTDSILLEADCKDNVKVKRRGRQKKIKTEGYVPKKQICEECGESVKDLKQHSITHVPVQDRKRIKCDLCDKTFCSYGSRYKHKRLKHLGIKQKCQECGKEVTSLKSHMTLIHQPELLKKTCVMCGLRFLSQSLLDLHMLKHTKDKPNECDICKKRFRLKLTLQQHKRQVHELEKSHLCQYCPKTFFKKYHLEVHMRSHTKERPYKCEQCERTFSDSSTLRNHRDTHNTEKNFHCEHCDMKFVRRDYLRVHLVCHTKEKRYPCKYCGVRFGRSDHRKRHQYTAHEKHLQLPTHAS